MEYVTLKTNIQGYAPDQCGNTMTVQELIDQLSEFNPDAKVYFCEEGFHTTKYGSVNEWSLDLDCNYDEEDEGEE